MLFRTIILLLIATAVMGRLFAQPAEPDFNTGKTNLQKGQAQQLEEMYHQGLQLRDSSDLEQSRFIFRHLKQFSIAAGNSKMEALSNFLLGKISSSIGREDSTLYYYFEALNIAEKNRLDSIATAACISISVSYRFAYQYREAHVILDKALLLAQKSKAPLLLQRVLSEKALLLSWEEQPAKSLEMHFQILPQILQSGDNYWITITHMSIAYCYEMLADNGNRNKWLQAFIHDLETKPMPEYLLTNMVLVAGILHNNAGNYKEAEKYLQRSIVLSEKFGINRHLQRAYKALSNTDSATGNFKEALAHYKLSQHYKEIVAGEKIKHNMKELEVKYQTAQKDKELAENRLKLRNRDKWIGFGIIIIVVGLATTIILHLHNKQKHLLQENYLLNLRKEHELHLLQAAMQGEEKERKRLANDLHDGVAGMLAAAKMHFSTIRQSMPPLQQSAEFHQAFKLLDEASDAIRRTAHNLAPDTLTIYGLVEALRIYCNNVTCHNSLSVSLGTLNTIPPFTAHFELNLYRIIQELISNTIKHTRANTLIIQFSIHEDILCVTIEDDGEGFDTATTSPGLGLTNIHQRIQVMQGIFEMNSAPGKGTSVYMEFPTTNILL